MTEESNVTPLHNVADINDAITHVFKEVLANENYIAELTEEHIAPVKKDVKELWGTVKAKTDMELDELKLLYKVYKRQQQAKHFDDEEDRNRVADNFRTAFSALAHGQMFDFLDVLETEHKPAVVQDAEETAEAEAEEQAQEQAAAEG